MMDEERKTIAEKTSEFRQAFAQRETDMNARFNSLMKELACCYFTFSPSRDTLH